jgi:DNA polymerase-3 subunit delta
MTALVHAFDFLEQAGDLNPVSLCVAFGDDRFLKRLVVSRIRQRLAGSEDAEMSATVYQGDKAQWRDIRDELQTRSLFHAGPRIVVVEDADEFVTQNRGHLEELAAAPRTPGCLLLDVLTFPGNTRLYKAALQSGLVVECRAPRQSRGRGNHVDEKRVCKWITTWARTRHNIDLARSADEELLDLVGPELGLLDQELATLALVANGDKVTIQLVRDIVGGWRAKTTWELLDAALAGQAGAAIHQLARLLQAGEAPQAIFGAMAWSLRRFAAAAATIAEAERAGNKITLSRALEQVGFKNWPAGALGQAERQLRQIGRHRAGQLYTRLLQADLAMKGSHSTPERTRWVLENLLLWLSREAAASPPGAVTAS